MANKRDIKKGIKYVCGAIAGECILARDFIPGINAEEMNAIILDLALLQENALTNCTFAFDKTPKDFPSKAEYNKAAKAYYHLAFKTFRDEFNNHIQEIVKRMNALLPEAQREANKKVAATK